MRNWLLLAPLLLASCAASENKNPGLDQVPPGSACTSTALDSFVGQPASADLGARMLAASHASKLRWVPFGAVITMDFSPMRLTVRLDQQNRVASATCS